MHRWAHAVVWVVVAQAALVVLQAVGLGHKALQVQGTAHAHAPYLGLRCVWVQLRPAVRPVAGVQCAVAIRPEGQRASEAGRRKERGRQRER